MLRVSGDLLQMGANGDVVVGGDISLGGVSSDVVGYKYIVNSNFNVLDLRMKVFMPTQQRLPYLLAIILACSFTYHQPP